MDEHTDERLNWLRKLQLGLDKYQVSLKSIIKCIKNV